MNHPRDISNFALYYRIKNYCYEFGITGEVLKYGKANDKEWQRGTWCDRIYRQAGGIDGWRRGLNCSTASVTKERMKTYFPLVTKDEVYIRIYDYTHDLVNDSNDKVEAVLLNAENKMIRDYVDVHGTKPRLNIAETKSHAYISSEVSALFDGL
jgi:hypothetical protein